MTKHKSAGFILFYVVALIAALTVILAQVQQRRSIPHQSERQLAHALQVEEGGRLLEFVLAGTEKQKNPTDPRLLQFQRLLSDDPARLSEKEEALAQLKALLDQLGFSLDIGGGSRGTSASMTQSTSQESEGVLFAPRKDPYKIKLGERQYTIRIFPGNALPNLNALPYENLWRYIRFLGLGEEAAKDLAANLVDWRDSDNFRTDERGAEQEYYYSLPRPYPPRNGLIRSWQELAYVKDVTPDRLQLLRDNFMLAGANNLRVHVSYVSPEGMAALSGLSVGIVRAILKEYGQLDAKTAKETTMDVAEVLLGQDATAFDKVAAWNLDETLMRIEITGNNVTLHADYDVRRKKVLARW